MNKQEIEAGIMIFLHAIMEENYELAKEIVKELAQLEKVSVEGMLFSLEAAGSLTFKGVNRDEFMKRFDSLRKQF